MKWILAVILIVVILILLVKVFEPKINYRESVLEAIDKLTLRGRDAAYGASILNYIIQKHRLSAWRGNIGIIYLVLDQLEEEGLIRAHIGEATADRGWRHKVCWTLIP